MNSKKWTGVWLTVSLILLIPIGVLVYRIDPYFHYHAPDVETYFYVMDNERAQNDGISRNFDYNAVLTGSSMMHNFRTSEADERFDRKFIKLTYSAAGYDEVGAGLQRAFLHHPEIRTVIRCLDLMLLIPNGEKFKDPPEYLYDEDPFNDIRYLMNCDVIFKRTFPMITARRKADFQPGITSFDDYMIFRRTCGPQTALLFGMDEMEKPEEEIHLSDEERQMVQENIEQNVLAVVREHPETEFYFFFPPYSVVWWQWSVSDGSIYRQIEAEKLATEMILEYQNVRLFSFTCRTDITSDLNNYSDNIHYGYWINSLILKWLQEDSYRLTRENYCEYLEREQEYYLGYDYDSMRDQVDYEDDTVVVERALSELKGSVIDRTDPKMLMWQTEPVEQNG